MNRLMCAWKKKSMGPHTNSLSFNSAVSLSLPLSGARERKDEKKSPLLSAYLLSLCHQSRLYEQKKFESGDKEELFFGSLVLFFPSSDLSTSSSLSLSPPLSLPLLLLLRHLARLDFPDVLGILLDRPVAREHPGTGHAHDRHLGPPVLIAVCRVDPLLGLDVAREVVGDEVVVRVGDRVAERLEEIGPAESAAPDHAHDVLEARVGLEVRAGGAEGGDLVRGGTEDEHVVCADFL